MSIAKNTIRFSDITTTPIKLKYSSSFASSSLASYGITQNKGVNVPTVLSGSVLSPNVQYALKYKTIQQLYYKEYISSSLLGTGSGYNPSLQSTAASGSYDNDLRYFPTASGDEIRFFAIPTRTFGEQIARKTFTWESTNNSTYKIIDDGNGNIVDAFNNYEHVGNILYAQGIVTVVNTNYIPALSDNHFTFSVSVIPPSPSISVSPSLSITPSVTPSITQTPSVTLTPTVSITPTVSVSNTPGLSISLTPSISITPSITPSITLTPSKTPTVSITPSVTVSVSISPSLPSLYDFYLADEYTCDFPGCTRINIDPVPVAIPQGSGWLSTHYYSDIGHTGFVYKITQASTYAVAVILDTSFHSTNCTTVCSV